MCVSTKQEINRIIKRKQEITMITVSFLRYTIYNAIKYQYNLLNFYFLNKWLCFIINFCKINFLCRFQFPMCADFITCVHVHTHAHGLEGTQHEQLSVPSEKCWGSTINQARTISFHILSNSLFITLPCNTI